MNVVLTVVSGGLQNRHVFGPQGGRFGRSQKCDWVLPDPDLILSSVHGRISLIDGAFVLTDESTNGIFIGNGGEPIGKGNSVILSTGMRLRAGAYEIEARLAPDEAQVASLNPYAPAGFGSAQTSAMPQQFAPQPMPSWQQQPGTSNPASMPRVPAQQSRAEDALRQRSEYGDLWASNSQDPLAYLDNADAVRAKNEPQERRPTNTIPDGFYPGAPATSFATQQPMQPPVHQSMPGPSSFPADFDAYGSRPAPLNGSGRGEHSGSNPSQPMMPINQGSQGPTGRSAIPDDFLSRLVPAGKPAGQPPLPPLAAPLAPPPVASAPLPAGAPTARVPSPPDPAYTSPVTAIRNTTVDSFAIPDNFDPLTSLMGNAKPVDPYPGLPHVAGSARQAIPPLPALPVRPPATPLPDMVLPPANPPVQQAEQLSPALMADVVRIEPLAVVPEKRATADKDVFDPLEALRSRREERTAALERKTRREPPPLHAGAMPLTPVAAAPLPPQPAPLPAASMPGAAMPSPVTDGRDAVLAALFKGMGFPDNTALPPDGDRVAENVGMMVREIGKGLVQLLSARQMLKAEFRMDETQMRPEENNPFKYYKIAELALDELFVTKSGGFHDPAKAASSAFEDVQQYVMLTTAAIQRAMTLMFQRLSPEAIAREAEGDGGLRIRGLGGGKGKWETYVENHARMSGRLEGLTRQIISEAFAQVQEEQARKTASEFWEKKK